MDLPVNLLLFKSVICCGMANSLIRMQISLLEKRNNCKQSELVNRLRLNPLCALCFFLMTFLRTFLYSRYVTGLIMPFRQSR
jgi:hypothetical protein